MWQYGIGQDRFHDGRVTLGAALPAFKRFPYMVDDSQLGRDELDFCTDQFLTHRTQRRTTGSTYPFFFR